MTFSNPSPRDGALYLTEGGFETELLYLHGFELPCFAAFTLLDTPRGTTALRELYERACDVAAAEGVGVVLGWLNYRASPDGGRNWGCRQTGCTRRRCARSTSWPISARPMPDRLKTSSSATASVRAATPTAPAAR